MRAVRMVQMALHQVIDMVAVGHGFVPAVGAVNVIGFMRAAVVLGRASILVGLVGRQCVFVHMIAVNVMQVAVVEIIGVAIVVDGGMAAIRSVNVSMPFVFAAGFRHRGTPRRTPTFNVRPAAGDVNAPPFAEAQSCDDRVRKFCLDSARQ